MMPVVLVVILVGSLAFVATVALALALGYLSITWVARLLRPFGRPPLPRSVSQSLQDARRYGYLMRKTVQQHPAGLIRDRLTHTLTPVDEWLNNLSRLEAGLRNLYGGHDLAHDLHRVTRELQNLQKRQSLAVSQREADGLRVLIQSMDQHLASLKELQDFQAQAELRVQRIASDLGATHADMLLIGAKGDFNDSRLRRLDESLQDRLANLKDMLDVMDEMGFSGNASRENVAAAGHPE